MGRSESSSPLTIGQRLFRCGNGLRLRVAQRFGRLFPCRGVLLQIPRLHTNIGHLPTKCVFTGLGGLQIRVAHLIIRCRGVVLHRATTQFHALRWRKSECAGLERDDLILRRSTCPTGFILKHLIKYIAIEASAELFPLRLGFSCLQPIPLAFIIGIGHACLFKHLVEGIQVEFLGIQPDRLDMFELFRIFLARILESRRSLHDAFLASPSLNASKDLG